MGKGENMDKDQQVLVEINNSLRKMENFDAESNMFQSLIKLRQLLKKRKEKWLDVQDSDAFYFNMAIRTALSVLDSMQYRFKKSHKEYNDSNIADDSLNSSTKTEQKLKTASEFNKSFLEAFPKLLSEIESIINITSKFDINKERIDQVAKNMCYLVKIAHELKLIEHKRISQIMDEDKATRLYAKLMKNLNANS
ncbi:MAG: hypothetical protein OXC46_07365 [Thaumarchaeota archaeon]|nr:hypothetical protein [Nitrososphaerota archaeon]